MVVQVLALRRLKQEAKCSHRSSDSPKLLVAKDDLELLILLPSLPGSWDYWCGPVCLYIWCQGLNLRLGTCWVITLSAEPTSPAQTLDFMTILKPRYLFHLNILHLQNLKPTLERHWLKVTQPVENRCSIKTVLPSWGGNQLLEETGLFCFNSL